MLLCPIFLSSSWFSMSRGKNLSVSHFLSSIISPIFASVSRRRDNFSLVALSSSSFLCLVAEIILCHISVLVFTSWSQGIVWILSLSSSSLLCLAAGKTMYRISVLVILSRISVIRLVAVLLQRLSCLVIFVLYIYPHIYLFF